MATSTLKTKVEGRNFRAGRAHFEMLRLLESGKPVKIAVVKAVIRKAGVSESGVYSRLYHFKRLMRQLVGMDFVADLTTRTYQLVPAKRKTAKKTAATKPSAKKTTTKKTAKPAAKKVAKKVEDDDHVVLGVD